MNVVNIVHCVDTEGPLSEPLRATFDRIKQTFGFVIPPSRENLIKLQKKQYPLKNHREAISNMVSEERLDYRNSWDKIDMQLNEITSEENRKALMDSFENGWIFNWFCLDHVGFNKKNPRKRDIGFHKIFDHYQTYREKNKSCETDLIQWHFHPLSLTKDAHKCGTAYVASKTVFEILARKIIDRLWFPAAYRPGFHTERPDSNWFLEQWIPFDYGNQSVKGNPTDQPDLSEGRFGDWRNAPKEWNAYHPHHDDYQKIGSCRRWIARCLNIEARLRQIKLSDVEEAFERAALGHPTLLSFTNHDFRNMNVELKKIRDMISKVSSKYPETKFRYCNAIQGMRNVIGIKNLENPKFNIEAEGEKKVTIKIKSKNDIFGPQPFFCIKTRKGEYFWDNLDFQGPNNWSYTLDFNTLSPKKVEKIGVAANTNAGVTEVVVYDIHHNSTSRRILNH